MQPELGSVPPTPAGSGDDMQSRSDSVDSADAALNTDSIKHSYSYMWKLFLSLCLSAMYLNSGSD